MSPAGLLACHAGATRRSLLRGLVIAAVTPLVSSGCGDGSPDGATERALGAVAHVGAATASSYAEFEDSGAPLAIGLAFSNSA